MTGKPPPKWILFLFLIILFFLGQKYFNLQEAIQNILNWIEVQGFFGALVYLVIYILACVFMVPGSLLTMGAGFIYGIVWGSVLVSVAATLGATVAFLIGRFLTRDWVLNRIEGNLKFAAIDSAVEEEGWKIVLLTRLSPIFPFNLLNYAYGLTKVTLKDYFLPSWLGMIPGTILYVYIGSLFGDLIQIGIYDREKGIGEWTLYGVGLIATVLVVFIVSKKAKEILNQKIKEDG